MKLLGPSIAYPVLPYLTTSSPNSFIIPLLFPKALFLIEH